MNINLNTPICFTGYGVAGTNLIKALVSQGHKIALWPIGQSALHPEDVPTFQPLVENTRFYDVTAPCVKIWHQFDLAQFIGKGKHIGFPIFELDKFNDIERHHLASVDKLFVCSKWAKQIIINTIPGQYTVVVPLGVNHKIFYPSNITTNDNKPYTFFNAGKWEVRKGHDILVEIFNKAFELEDDVQLWLMSNNPFLTPEESEEWAKKYKTSKLGSKIHIISPCQTHYEVAGIMRQTDCGIFPSRAEGWNLELLEMMACGKPCIATNYSAHTEFCTREDTWFIDIEETELAQDGKWFFGQGSWAKIGEKQIDQAVEHMRFMYKNRPNGLNSREQSKKFSWENSAEIFVKEIF
jgi:glycosyltransferase involved in cell wall biosynthesis